MVSSRTRDRAQLILVGALMLATVIFGLSMLLNSMLFTGASGNTGATAAVEETDFVDYDVELGMRQLIVRLNHGDRNVSASRLGDYVNWNVSNYSAALGEARARTGSIALTVDYNNSSSDFGRRIVQDHNADMTDADGGAGSGHPVPTSANSRIGWFSLSVDVENTSTGFAAIASNGSNTVRLDIDENDTAVDIEVDNGTGSTTKVTCGSERGRVLLDLYAGTAFTDRCEFPGIGELDRPTGLEFEQPDELVGKYAIVINRSHARIGTGPVDLYPRCIDSSGTPRGASDAEPCVTPAVWSANVTTQVEGDSVSYENSYNLTVYTNER